MLFLSALFLTVSTFVLAQTPTTSPSEIEEKQQAQEKVVISLLNQIVNDAALLKLGENRALVLASAADLIWVKDQKRARLLFRQAADEIVQFQNAPKPTKKAGERELPDFITRRQSPRSQILLTVAKRDADLALQLLRETRTAELEAAIQAENNRKIEGQPKIPVIASESTPWELREIVRDEIRLEQSFAAQAIETDPKKAAQLIRQQIAKDPSYSTLNAIRKIEKKDAELAETLFDEFIEKLEHTDFTKQKSEDGNVNLAFSFLRADRNQTSKDAKPSQLKIEEKTKKILANKIADWILQNNEAFAAYNISYMVPGLIKFLPERAAALNQKQEALKKSNPDAFEGGFLEADKLIDEATPEKMFSEAAKINNPSARSIVYREATHKMTEAGNGDKARALVDAIPNAKERGEATDLLNNQLADQAVKDGKFDEVRKLFVSLDKSDQINLIVKMALSYGEKKTEADKEAAVKLMAEARGMVNDYPESQEEINDLISVAAGYAVIEPKQAFPLIEIVADVSNELLSATASLSRFNKNDQTFRRGEMIMTVAFSQAKGKYGRFGKEIGLLAQFDFDRTLKISDKFQRTDTRIISRLLILQSLLNEKLGLDGAENSYSYFSF